MDTYYRPTRAEISLGALRHNIESFREALSDGIKIMAVVKANAYGHGAVQVAREAVDCGVDYLAVAFLDEALELRRAGIRAPVLVLGYTGIEGLALAAEWDITLNVYSEDVLMAIANGTSQGVWKKPIKIHIKVDTGMGRIGLPADEEAIRFVERANALPGVIVEGLFTHYARADELDKSHTQEQYDRFCYVLTELERRGIHLAYAHAGNSATAIDCPQLACNMVRLGISMYGFYPSAEVNRKRIDLQPVLTLKTAVVMCKRMPTGSGVGYGSIYRTVMDEHIATLPIGYADGYTRMLTGRAHALVRGRKVPVVGRICMDQCMINVTGVPEVKMGDEVVLIGQQGEERITADELAMTLGTIHYEVTCMIARRVPRIFIKNGIQTDSCNYLSS